MIREQLPRWLRTGAPGWRWRWWCDKDHVVDHPTVDEVYKMTLEDWASWLAHPTVLTPMPLKSEPPYSHVGTGDAYSWDRDRAEAKALGFSGLRERLAYEIGDPDREDTDDDEWTY